MANTYDIGDLVRIRAMFVSTDMTTPADPSTMIFRILSPVSGVACYAFGAGGASVTRTGVGAYYKDITPNAHGQWAYNAVATGGIQAAAESTFSVGYSAFI